MKYLFVALVMLMGSSAFAAGACATPAEGRAAVVEFQKSFHSIQRAGKLLELYVGEEAYDDETESLGKVYNVHFFKIVDEAGVIKNISGDCQVSKSGDCGDAVDCSGSYLTKETL